MSVDELWFQEGEERGEKIKGLQGDISRGGAEPFQCAYLLLVDTAGKLITVSIYRVEVANKKHRARYLPVALERHNSTVLCCCLLKWQPEMGWDEQVCCCSWPGATNVGKVCTDQHREAGEKLVTVSLLTMRKIFPNLS